MSSFTKPAARTNTANRNSNKSDLWLNLSIVKEVWVEPVAARAAVKASAAGVQPIVKAKAAVKAVAGHYIDAVHTEDDPSRGYVKGEPVIVNIQKGLGLMSDTKLGRSFIEALGNNPGRVFKMQGSVHMVTAESETETYGL